jgi:hypothetical protein
MGVRVHRSAIWCKRSCRGQEGRFDRWVTAVDNGEVGTALSVLRRCILVEIDDLRGMYGRSDIIQVDGGLSKTQG